MKQKKSSKPFFLILKKKRFWLYYFTCYSIIWFLEFFWNKNENFYYE
jgi:hypothetical protein